MSYGVRIALAVLAGLSIATWQVSIALREGNAAWLVGAGLSVALGFLIPAFVFYVRALPRLEITKRLSAPGGTFLFAGRIHAQALAGLGQDDARGVTDVVLAVDADGLHIHPATPGAGAIVLPFSQIVDVSVSGDGDPRSTAGMVSLTLTSAPHELSVTLIAPFMWGAFGATPATTQRFVDAVRSRVATPSP